jgi:hypothetical protein
MNISFMLSTEQVRDKSKDVTPRLGWEKLRPGAILRAVEKGMGLKKGEKVNYLTHIMVVSVRREKLRRMLDDEAYGVSECRREGFGNHPVLCRPAAFVKFFCESHKGCTPETEVTRIEFAYVDSRVEGGAESAKVTPDSC